MLPQKIYVIMRGWYSDMSVEAATTDPVRAEQLRRMHSDIYDEARIEEFEDGVSPYSHTPVDYYDVLLDEDGNVVQVYHAFDKPDLVSSYRWERGPYGEERLSIMKIRANDEEHAVKIARDGRAVILAKEAGI